MAISPSGRTRLFRSLIFAGGLACAGCLNVAGSANAVGPAGGSVSAEGARVEIPPGALSSTVTIQVALTSAFPPAPRHTAFGQGVFELTPHGQSFEKDVLVFLPGAEGDSVLTAMPGGTWKPCPCVTPAEGEQVATVRHFSFFASAAIGSPGGRIVFSSGNSLVSMDLDGGNPVTLVPGAAPDHYVTGVSLDTLAGQVYWTDNVTDQVSRISFDGGVGVALYTSPDRFLNPGGVAVDIAGGKLFWAEGGAVRASDLDGQAVQTLVPAVPNINYVSDVAFDPCARQLYWADQGTDTVYRADYSGANTVALYSNPDPSSNPRAVAVDTGPGRLFWAEGFDVRAANLDGSQAVVIVQGGFQSNYPTAIALDRHKQLLYWTDNMTDTVSVATYDGTGSQVLYKNLDPFSNPHGIAVDPGR